MKPFATTFISTSIRVAGFVLAALTGVVIVLAAALFAVAMTAALSLAGRLPSLRPERVRSAEEPQLTQAPAH